MALTGKKASQLSAATITAFKNVFGIPTIESNIAEKEALAYVEPNSNYFYDNSFEFKFGFIPRCKIQKSGKVKKITDITLFGDAKGNTIYYEVYLDATNTVFPASVVNLVASGTIDTTLIPVNAKYGNIEITLPTALTVAKDQWLKVKIFCNTSLTTLYYGIHQRTYAQGLPYAEAIEIWYLNASVSAIQTGSLNHATYGTYAQNAIKVYMDNAYGEMGEYANKFKNSYVKPDAFKMLLLGDSYTSLGAWVNVMTGILNPSSVLNLGVGNATLKDKYTDRVTYPYTSRPLTANSGGNLNVLACQIEKLKRLMAGTDLDSGERKWYATEAEYPNVIIIQGALNDNYDPDVTIAAMNDQFTKSVTTHLENGEPVAGVYQRLNDNSIVSLPNMVIKKPLSEVDRTTFAGAYRYLVEELNTLFPKAQIFIATVTRLAYMGSNEFAVKREKQATQQRLIAQRLSCPVIDWAGETGINELFNHPQTGSGTLDDPYLLSYVTRDSIDSIHPNAFGAKKLGRLAAKTIKEKYLDLYN